jgi:hypothetical protein
MTADTSEDLKAVWAGGNAEAFAVGANGVALRYDGFSWQHETALEGLTDKKLVSIVGFDSPLELFVLAEDGTVFHFAGTWKTIDSASALPLVALAGIARDNVIGVGIGEVWRLNGTAWTQIPTGSPVVNFHGVWAAGPNDIYAVGEASLGMGLPATDGVVRRYDGSAWTTAHSIADTPWTGVGGSGANDIYVAGVVASTAEAAAHYNGMSWQNIPNASASGIAVWASAADDVFVAGDSGIYQFTDKWSHPSAAPIAAIHGSTRQNVLAVGPAGTIWRYAPR